MRSTTTTTANAIFYLLLTQFLPNFKGRFLGSITSIKTTTTTTTMTITTTKTTVTSNTDPILTKLLWKVQKQQHHHRPQQ